MRIRTATLPLFLCGLAICSLTPAQAQEPADALRFSWTVPGGTARTQAIGGAMGALGGDITAAFANPAGLAFYRTGDLVASPVYRQQKTKANYLGRTETTTQNKLTWGTSGVVFGSGSSGQGRISSTAVTLAYNRTADFNNTVFYKGATNKSSYSQKFLEEIGTSKNANSVASDYPFGASLALNTYWIDTVRGAGGEVAGFQTRAPVAGGLLQQQSSTGTGGIDEFVLGAGVSMGKQLLLGATIGLPYLHYERRSEYTEADATDNAANQFNYAQISEDLRTRGLGINARLGLIYKPQESWRLGLAFHTPTLYTLTDNYFVSVATDSENNQGLQLQNSEFVSGAPSEFKYILATPYRVMGSVAYVLHEVEDVSKQRGFLSADVEYVNYKAASYQPDEENMNDQTTRDYLQLLNRAIDNAYKGAFNVRVGGELKFTTLMLRAGAAYYGNPYQSINGEKGNRLNLSGGLGYRDNGFFADITYVHGIHKDVQFAYRLQNKALYSGAHVRNTVGTVLLTFGFKL